MSKVAARAQEEEGRPPTYIRTPGAEGLRNHVFDSLGLPRTYIEAQPGRTAEVRELCKVVWERGGTARGPPIPIIGNSSSRNAPHRFHSTYFKALASSIVPKSSSGSVLGGN